MIAVIGAEFTGNKMDEAKAAIEMLDVDKDGKVSYPEFILVMKYKKQSTLAVKYCPYVSIRL